MTQQQQTENLLSVTNAGIYMGTTVSQVLPSVAGVHRLSLRPDSSIPCLASLYRSFYMLSTLTCLPLYSPKVTIIHSVLSS